MVMWKASPVESDVLALIDSKHSRASATIAAGLWRKQHGYSVCIRTDVVDVVICILARWSGSSFDEHDPNGLCWGWNRVLLILSRAYPSWGRWRSQDKETCCLQLYYIYRVLQLVTGNTEQVFWGFFFLQQSLSTYKFMQIYVWKATHKTPIPVHDPMLFSPLQII